MAAVAGVLIYHEAPSRELGLGVVSTIAGLLMMKQGRRPQPLIPTEAVSRDRNADDSLRS
jgi:hypothetical protein